MGNLSSSFSGKNEWGNLGSLSGSRVGGVVLPAQHRDLQVSDDYASHLAALRQEFPVSAARIPTSKGSLSSLLVRPEGADQIVVYCRGNGEFFQDSLHEIEGDLRSLGCAVLSWNYPGVNDSEGRVSCAGDLIDAAVELVQHLVEHHGFTANKVLLKGHSLGGAVATHAAGRLHTIGHPVQLFVGRSFADIASVGTALTGQTVPAGRRASMVYSSIKSLSMVTGWNLNSAKIYRSLPDSHKMCINARDDHAIPLSASLFAGTHVDQDRTASMCLFNAPAGTDAHNVPLSHLTNDDGLTAETVFRAFAQQRPAAAPPDARTALHSELAAMTSSDLRKRAETLGIAADTREAAENAENAKAAWIELIMTYQVAKSEAAE